MRWLALSLLIFTIPGCGFLSYELARIEVGTAIELEAYPALVEGETTFSDALEVLGPPDEIRIGWEEDGRQFTQLFFRYQKRRTSNLKIQLPLRDAVTYNAGLRFFAEFFRVMRGDGSVLSEAQDVALSPSTAGQVFRGRSGGRTTESGTRLERSGGRAHRLSDERENGALAGERGPLAPVDPLQIEGAARGRDLILLVFDADGVLVRKSLKLGTPRTDFVGQMGGSLLR